jgi:hypothetical protein
MATASDHYIFIKTTLSAQPPFALGFIFTNWNLLQKRVWHLVLFVKKIGSRQIAVNAFLGAAVSDDMMLDQWIPDKDWVHWIQENGQTSCSIVNLNIGLALQCVWQNNHATLHGRTVFNNRLVPGLGGSVCDIFEHLLHQCYRDIALVESLQNTFFNLFEYYTLWRISI